MKIRLYQLFLTAFLLGILSPKPSCIAADPDANTLRWIQQVTLGPEFGGDGDVCSQWTKAPTVSVHGGNADQRFLIEKAVDHLNTTLEHTRLGKMTMRPPDSAADITVYFAPLDEFPALARKHGFRYVEGNWGYFWTFWAGRNRISRAYVMLANDKLEGAHMQHFALEELTQSLGLSNDSSVFKDSVFYSEGADGGNAQRLSVLDRKLLAFFYTHATPGMNGEALREAIKKHWK